MTTRTYQVTTARPMLHYLHVKPAPHSGVFAYAVIPIYAFHPADAMLFARELFPHVQPERLEIFPAAEYGEAAPP